MSKRKKVLSQEYLHTQNWWLAYDLCIAVELAAPKTAKERASEFKTQGNEAYAKNDYYAAIQCFSQAIQADPSDHVFYSNRSACWLNLRKHKSAISDAQDCIRMAPRWPKGYSRLGCAYLEREDGHLALEAFTNAKRLDPENADSYDENLEKAREMSMGQKKPSQDRPEPSRNTTAPPPTAPAAPKVVDTSPVIGIDLGTTYSCVGVWQNGRAEIIANEHGNRITPSSVAFTDSERLVGESAKNQASSNPTNTIFEIKRIIGQRYTTPGVLKDIKHFPFTVNQGEGDKPLVEVQYNGDTAVFTPEQLSAMVLTKMKETAEAHLGHEVHRAVVTVPAYFNDAQRTATKNAGTIAGLDVMRVINEPTAAALAYGLDASARGRAAKVLVFDLGGGTFDATLLEMDDDVFEVRATGGDTRLGGEDFDTNLTDYLVSEIKKKHKKDPTKNPRAMRRLRTAAERAKRMLSSSANALVEVDSLLEDLDFTCTVTKAKFESLNAEFFQKCIKTVEQVLVDAKLAKSDVDDVVLVGGSTRIPKVQQLLSEFFDGKELCRAINPDEAVAYGAAVQGAVLSGVKSDETNSLLLVDVTPLSLGIETVGSVMSTVIKRNTPIPCSKSDIFTTEQDDQTQVDVEVYEGERQCTDGNNKLGQFTISGIERAKRGVPKVEVKFDLDANGILQVTARDQVTGAEAAVSIDNASKGLDQDEINRMIAEAEKYKEEDAARVQRQEMKSHFESFLSAAGEKADDTGDRDMKDTIQKWHQWLDEHSDASRGEIERSLECAERQLGFSHR